MLNIKVSEDSGRETRNTSFFPLIITLKLDYTFSQLYFWFFTFED